LKTLLGYKEELLASGAEVTVTNNGYAQKLWTAMFSTLDSPCLDADVGSQSHEH